MRGPSSSAWSSTSTSRTWSRRCARSRRSSVCGPAELAGRAVQRVVVLGPGGAGKSVLASSIARRTGLPVVHLDVLFWRPGWTPAPREEALRALRAAIAADRWVLDGNFLPEHGE